MQSKKPVNIWETKKSPAKLPKLNKKFKLKGVG